MQTDEKELNKIENQPKTTSTLSSLSQINIDGQSEENSPVEEKFFLGNEGICCGQDEELSETSIEENIIKNFNGENVIHIKKGETAVIQTLLTELTWINGEISHRNGYVNAFTLNTIIGSYQSNNLSSEESYFNKGQSYELHTLSKEGIDVWIALRGEGSDPMVRVKNNISIAYDTTPGIYSIEPEFTIYEVGELPSAKVYRLPKYYIQVIE